MILRKINVCATFRLTRVVIFLALAQFYVETISIADDATIWTIDGVEYRVDLSARRIEASLDGALGRETLVLDDFGVEFLWNDEAQTEKVKIRRIASEITPDFARARFKALIAGSETPQYFEIISIR
ncbi:MAG: hypothetical protein HUK22_08680, partial [Thermoguttaceae bacterium]|nr:hypothetical protein [Thermoguttaceae bacterium]